MWTVLAPITIPCLIRPQLSSIFKKLPRYHYFPSPPANTAMCPTEIARVRVNSKQTMTTKQRLSGFQTSHQGAQTVVP